MYRSLEFILFFCTISLTKAVTVQIDGLIDIGPNWNYEKLTLNPEVSSNRRKHYYKNDHNNVFRQRVESSERERLRQDEEKLRKAEERLRKEAAELRLAQAEALKEQRDSELKNQESKEKTKPQTDVVSDKENSESKEKHEKRKPDDDDTNKSIKHDDKKNKKRYKIKGNHDKPDKRNKPDKIDEKHDKPDKKLKKNKKKEKHKPSKSSDHSNASKKTKKRKQKRKHKKKTKDSSDAVAAEVESNEDKSKVAKFSSASKSSENPSWFDSDDDSGPKKNTMINFEDFTPSGKQRHYLRESPRYSTIKTKRKGRTSKLNPLNETLIKDHINNKTHFNETLNGNFSNNLQEVNNTMNTTTTVNETTTTTTLDPKLTTVISDMYAKPHKVKDDPRIIEFTDHLYKQTLKVFDVVKEKTNDHDIKKQIDKLSKSYEDKFREFLQDTSSQKIKTRLGTQKVILNSIEMSDRIMRRLINFLIGDMDKKGTLRHNVGTANIFQKAIENEQKLELNHVCKKFGICQLGTGFPEFITDILTILLKCDDRKFKQSVDALTEVVKNSDYHRVLDSSTARRLKRCMDGVERQSMWTLRPSFMIVKNIIVNKNKPLVINNLAGNRRVNATVAFLEIIDLLDKKMPRDATNSLNLADIRKSYWQFAMDKRYDVLEIMQAVVQHLSSTVRHADKRTQRIFSKHVATIIE